MTSTLKKVALFAGLATSPFALAQETGTPAGPSASGEAVGLSGWTSVGITAGTAAVLGAAVAAGTDDDDEVTPETTPSTTTSTATGTN